MRPRDLARGLLVLALVAATGCASMSRKFTFMRPDVSRKSVTQVAPDYDVKPDKRGSARLAVSERMQLANARLRAGQFDQAETEAKAVLKLDPKSADAYSVLGLVADQRGQQAQAGVHYAKAAELAPRNGSLLNNYGAWLCGNGRAGESLDWFDRALADPGYGTPASAQANAGACAVKAGQPARAERDLRLALQREPANATALGAMTQLEFDAGRYLQARAFSERRIAAAPADADVLRLASRIEQKLGDTPAAARYMQQSTSQGPSAADVQAGDRQHLDRGTP